MQSTHVVGIDPGIVHTGVVSLTFHPHVKEIVVSHWVNLGPVLEPSLADAIKQLKAKVFVERYRARSNLQHDKRMQQAETNMVAATRGTALDNTGVKKIVKPAVLIALGAWTFSTPTHHDDLRSAARIAVLGMMKDPDMNRLLADVIRDHLAGKPWTIRTI